MVHYMDTVSVPVFASRCSTKHGVQVHVGWLEGGTAVFAFRGTASRQDGLQDVKIFSRNIDYLQELYPGVKAHLGVLCSACGTTCLVEKSRFLIVLSLACAC